MITKTHQDAAEVAAPAKFRATFVVLASATLSFALLQSLVTPVLLLLQHDLHTTQSAATWIFTAYLLSACVCTPLLGRLGEIVGGRAVLAATLVVLGLGCVLAAVADSLWVMIAARVVQGVGGGIIPLSFGIIRTQFPPARVGWAVGLISALLSAGGGVGLVLAGPIVEVLDVHFLFWIPACAVFIAAAATFRVVPATGESRGGRISATTTLALSGWLIAVVLAVSQGPIWGWGSPAVVVLLVLSVVLVVGWYQLERRSVSPLIDVTSLARPAVARTNLVSLLMGIVLYSVLAFLPRFVQTPSDTGYGFGASVTASGLILLPLSVAMFVAGSAAQRLSGRFSAKRILLAATLIASLGLAILSATSAHVSAVAVALAVLGTGIGLAFSSVPAVIIDSVPSEQAATATGMNANIRTLGGAFGTAVVASILTANQNRGLPTANGYFLVFLVLAGTALLAGGAAAFIPRRPDRDAAAEEPAA